MMVMNDVMVVVMRMVLLWGYGSIRLLLLVSLLLLLLHEVKLLVPLAIQAIPLSLFTFAFPLSRASRFALASSRSRSRRWRLASVHQQG